MKVKLIWITDKAESIIGYCARVSNPQNQDNPEIEKLIKYCIDNKHWSIFEMANMCVEIETSRAISAQILRHKSFSFQEFSQRYAIPDDFEKVRPRRQDFKNRQNSIDDLDWDTHQWFSKKQYDLWRLSEQAFEECIEKGIAKEVARFLLPMSTQTRLYMNGTIRSWIHYLDLRTGNGTQLEHKLIADECKKIFVNNLPLISKSLNWYENK